MKMLSETFISLCDLAEAEGRLLKQKTIQTAVVVMFIFIALVFLAVALGLMLTACFQGLLTIMNAPIAYLITSFVTTLLAGGLLWIGLNINRKVF